MRSAVSTLIVLALAATACGGGTKGESSTEAPQEMGDAFVAELLDGRPADAAERLSPIRSELEPQLPAISIQLQTNGYRVVETRRKGNKTIIYVFRGRPGARPATTEWEAEFENDLGQWGIVTFEPTGQPDP